MQESDLLLGNVKEKSRLKAGEKYLYMQTVIRLGLMRIALSFLPFQWFVRSLRQSKQIVYPIRLLPEQCKLVESVAHVVTLAAQKTPWENPPVVQALTAQRLLKAHGIPGVIYLGVAYDAETTKKMKAYVWLQSDNVSVPGTCCKGYTVLSSFSWE